MNARRLLAFGHALNDPATRFRIRQYEPCFNEAGWHLSLSVRRPEHPETSPLRNRLARRLHQEARVFGQRLRRLRDIRSASRHDAVLLSRDLLAGDISLAARLFRRNPRVVFDVDDAIHLGAKAAWVEWICRRAAWVTAGNDMLAAFASRFTDRVTVLPTVVDADAYAVREVHATDAPVRVGWIGSDRSARKDLVPHLRVLETLQRELGFDVVVVTKPRPRLDTGLRWTYIEWSPEVETRVGHLFDIGIMPLPDQPFERGKCGCKLLQYMAGGLPSIASPVGVNTALVAHGTRGYLARSEAEWHDALRALVADPDLRARMGQAARQFVSDTYSRRRWFPVLLDIVERVAGEPHVR